MNPSTAALLRAVADLASYSQGHPTDSKGISFRVQARNKAATAWVQAGCPDLPTGTPRPAVIAPGTGRVDDDGEKDWTRTEIMVEVKRVTEKAFLLDAGDGAFWCPRSIASSEDRMAEPGDIARVILPRWVLP